jgi:hypothetical protein
MQFQLEPTTIPIGVTQQFQLEPHYNSNWSYSTIPIGAPLQFQLELLDNSNWSPTTIPIGVTRQFQLELELEKQMVKRTDQRRQEYGKHEVVGDYVVTDFVVDVQEDGAVFCQNQTDSVTHDPAQ